MSSVELELNKLRREPENQYCGTCRKQDKIGHKNVCMKFRIFVCAECKSAHQAFSHKCKSVTMSNWSKEEVAELKGPVGGNARNRATVFAKLKDESDAWPKNAPPDVVKEFVQLAYDNKKWYDADATPRAARSTSAPDVSLAPTPAPSTFATNRMAPSVSAPSVFAVAPKVAMNRTAPLPETKSAVDLLGGDLLGGFDAFNTTSPAAKPTVKLPLGGVTSEVGPRDEWTAFSAAPAADTAASDEWADFASAPKNVVPMKPAVAVPSVVPMPASAKAEDPFGGFESAGFGAALLAPTKAGATAVPSKPAAPMAPAVPLAAGEKADPFSALGASGFTALGASAPLAKPAASVAAPAAAPPAAKPLSGVGVAKVISTGSATPSFPPSFQSSFTPSVAPSLVPPAFASRAPLGADFIDAAAFRAPRPVGCR